MANVTKEYLIKQLHNFVAEVLDKKYPTPYTAGTGIDITDGVISTDLGTAAYKNTTDRVQPNSTDPVESRSVYSAINAAVASIYTPAGDLTCAELTSALLIADNVGRVYELSDSGTTSDLFLQGAGKPLIPGDQVGIINAGQGRILFNYMANRIDLSAFQRKDLTAAVEGATTVEGTLSALSTNKVEKVTGKGLSTNDYDNTEKQKVANSVQKSNTAGLLKNDGTVDTTSYAKQNEMSVTNGTGADADKTTIQLKTGTSATVLKTHQDLTSYQTKNLSAAVESETTVEGSLGALSTNKQPKTLATTLKIGGINRTSVEDSLGALNNWKTSTISKHISFGKTSGDVYAFLDKCVELGILKKNTQMSFVLTQIYDHTVLWTFTDLNNFNANRCTIKFNGYYSVNSSDNTTNTFSLEIISWVNHVIYYYFEDRPNYGGPHSWRTVSTNPYYSTAEVFTGQYWIDNKPIYRKTYTGLSLQSPTANVWNSFNVAPPANAGLLIKSMIIRNDKVACEGIALKLDTTNNDIVYINPTFNASTNNVTLTIEYTKTTD